MPRWWLGSSTPPWKGNAHVDLVWEGVGTPSTERLHLTVGESILVRSRVAAGPARFEYTATLTRSWTFTSLVVRSDDGPTVRLERSSTGVWSSDGTARPDLADAVDIDLAFSPFTNTLPIRRLQLPVGTSAAIVTAYVAAPTLQVSTDPQRYTRVAPDEYLYESLDTDFSRHITVDADGFVVEYPGLFTRRS
jgi:hypothetical protein